MASKLSKKLAKYAGGGSAKTNYKKTSTDKKEIAKNASGGSANDSFKEGDAVIIINSNGVYDGHKGVVKEVFYDKEELDVVTEMIPDGVLVRFEDVIPLDDRTAYVASLNKRYNSRNEQSLMEEANNALQGYGVERIDEKGIKALYVNMGDTYDRTIVFDEDQLVFIDTNWGDWYEKNGGLEEKSEDEFKSGGPANKSKTGMYAKGGKVKSDLTKLVKTIPGNKDYPEQHIIVGVTKAGEIYIVSINKKNDSTTPHFSMSADTVIPYIFSDAKKYAKQYWVDFFTDSPDEIESMNERMGTKFKSPASAANYVIEQDGVLHGFDDYRGFSNVTPFERGNKEWDSGVLVGKKEYVFQHVGGGQNDDDFDNLVVKYLSDEEIEKLKSLWKKYHLKNASAEIKVPVYEQNKEAIIKDAVGASKNKFDSGGTVEYDFEDWSKYDDPTAAHEIELYADNNSDLYRQRKSPIIKNLKKKLDKGTFDVHKAATLWKYFVEDADKRYQKDFQDKTPKGYILSVKDRKLLSERYAQWTLLEYGANKLDGFAKGGSVSEENLDALIDKCAESGEEMLQSLVDDSSGFGYEQYYDARVEQVETASLPGFIPFTDGGRTIKWFEYADSLIGMGSRLPTNTLQKKMEEFEEQAYQHSIEEFKKKYPEIVEAVGEDKINYHDLQEEGYSSEAEDLDEIKREYMSDETIMFELGFYFYLPKNSKAVDGKLTCYVFGVVNLEAPYHRHGNLEDYAEESFTFSNEEGFKKKLAKSLAMLKDWYERGSYEKGRDLSIRRMAQGGSATVAYAELPDADMMARGGVARIANADAASHSENKIPFKGANLEGKTLDNGDYAVLSYGHYPIWYFSTKDNKWYGNKTKYSVTTSKQTTQSRPDWNAEMLEHPQLLEKMREYEAHFDLGGMMIKTVNPMTVDNTLGAHAGSPLSVQQESGL
jgi:hypothetical protein